MQRRRPSPPRSTVPKPSPALPSGFHLRRAVRAALGQAMDPTQNTRALAAALRGALAHTAAVGETCQVAAAAEAVRLAVHSLDTGFLDDARDQLQQALDALPFSSAPALTSLPTSKLPTQGRRAPGAAVVRD